MEQLAAQAFIVAPTCLLRSDSTHAAMAETTNTPAPVTPQGPRPFMIDLFSYPKALPKKTAETAHSVMRGISQLRRVAETGQDIPPSIKEELALAEELRHRGAALDQTCEAEGETLLRCVPKAIITSATAARNRCPFCEVIVSKPG